MGQGGGAARTAAGKGPRRRRYGASARQYWFGKQGDGSGIRQGGPPPPFLEL